MKASVKVGGVLLFCYLVAWLDRMAINMAIPFIMKDLQISATEVGWIVSAFFAGYAIFQIPGGMLADKVGPRKVITGALVWWSIFTAVTGSVFSVGSMLTTRFLFGIGEGIFPASVWKVMGNWFTKRNRATVNGLILSSIAIGPALTPPIMGWIIGNYGWRTSFFILGAVGVFCVLLTLRFVRDSIYQYPGIPRSEIDEYEADVKSQAATAETHIEKVSFGELAKVPVLWALFLTGLSYNIGAYGYLAWLPVYLMKVKGLTLTGTSFAASVPFVFATIGFALSGYISDHYFRGRRKTLMVGSMSIAAVCLWGFTQVSDVATYMILQCIAAGMLFLSVGSVWSLTVVLLPPRLFGSGSGFVNMGGQIGGFLAGILIGSYITFRGGDFAAGFDVMVGSLVVSILIMLVGIHEKTAPAQEKTLSG